VASLSPIIVWFRRDLRLADNPALFEAAQSGRPVVPVYLWEDDAPRPLGSAARWWLHHSLKALSRQLAALGVPLLLRQGRAIEELPRLAAEIGADTVLWNRRTAPREAALDTAVTRALVALGLRVESFNAGLLFEPGAVRTRSGQPFQVFTPFWRACLALPEPARPLPAPAALTGMTGLSGDAVDEWRLLPATPDWAKGIGAVWTPGEDAARARLCDFIEEGLTRYTLRRDHPDQDGTSRLSGHLAFGEIGPRQVWHAARRAGAEPADGFLRELGWREFSHHTLAFSPDFAEQPQRREFRDFPWTEDAGQWAAFIAGRTGYPIVDAGMRALWDTGWMHNRVRMIAASFLVKDLLIPWQRGEEWFWDTLIDADSAANAAGWQWVAGCGLDSAPYFRIFNPVVQGEKFDPRGRYVRRWLPELAGLSDQFIHRPWEASPEQLRAAGVSLGRSYPHPIIDHGSARRRALQAYSALRGTGAA